MKAAFMVIDMQKAFYSGSGAASMDAAAEYINAALPLFRKAGLPVLWVQDMDEEDGTVPGKPGFDLIESLSPRAGEARIHKTYGNSFNKTEAKALLDKAGIDTVILAGWKAEFCVLSTYRGALDLDLRPYLLKNAIATDMALRKDFVESISDTVPLSLLFRLIK